MGRSKTIRRIKTKPGSARATSSFFADSRYQTLLQATLLALITIALYWPAVRCGFINLDDPLFVVGNPHIQAGFSWQGLKWAFSNVQRGDSWAPFLWMSYMASCQFFGSDAWGHHLVNVMLHAANTTLCFLVFQRMTGARWRTLALAALFGWHPLRVESVVWVTERKDVLSGLFWMLTLWAYTRYVESTRAGNFKSKAWYGIALMMFTFGLMSKPMLVTLPCVLLLLDYWPLGRAAGKWRPTTSSAVRESKMSNLQLFVEKSPFFMLAVAASIGTFIIQKQTGSMMAIEKFPLEARVGNALVSYCRYLGKLFWPKYLSFFYTFPVSGYWPVSQVLLAAGILCGISILVFLQRRSYPFLLVGWLWFVGTLVPVIGLVQVGIQAMADRYTYIPSVGLLILIIWGAWELVRRWRDHKKVLAVIGSAAVILCLALTRQQIGYWKNSETLFRHALVVAGTNSFEGRNNLGLVYYDERLPQEAIVQFQEAIQLKPDDSPAHLNYGLALCDEGNLRSAIGQFQEAIRLDSNNAEAFDALGVAFLREGQADTAIAQFQTAVRLKPDYAKPHDNLGTALFHHGRVDEAVNEFQEAINLNPDDPDAHFNLGFALAGKNHFDEAIRQFQEVIYLNPNDVEAQNKLTEVLELKRKSSEQTSEPVKQQN